MKPSILSIGNATKDNFLDIGQPKVYKDDRNVFHYDLTFDDSTLEYRRQAGIFGGVILSERIFQAAHLKSFSNVNPRGLANFDFEKENYPILNRYIISHNAKSVILSSSPKKLSWVAPIYTPRYIYIADNILSSSYLDALKDYLKKNPEIELIFSLEDFDVENLRDFLPRARMVFANFNRPILGDIIDYSSPVALASSLADFGVNTVIVENGDEIIAIKGDNVVEIASEFEENSFYQKNVFRAALIGELLNGVEFVDGVKVASAIAHESELNNVVKPFFAQQILLRDRKSYISKAYSIAVSNEERMRRTAVALMAQSKGIFAADESAASAGRKFEAVGLDNSPENRRAYRQMFLSTPEIEKYLSGVILSEETAEQEIEGKNFVKYLTDRGILAGVKLDEGLRELPGFSNETVTAGLDKLAEKLNNYAKSGVSFAKWRAAFRIDTQNNLPSFAAISANVQILAQYAKMCQAAGIVPIVEPEVMSFGAHSVIECRVATERVLTALFEALRLFEVDISAVILKVNMILEGGDASLRSNSELVARETVEVLEKVVPSEIAGVVFLSGGQSSSRAAENLAEICRVSSGKFPMTFSFARALQDEALVKWGGDSQNVAAAQRIFFEKLVENSAAVSK